MSFEKIILKMLLRPKFLFLVMDNEDLFVLKVPSIIRFLGISFKKLLCTKLLIILNC